MPRARPPLPRCCSDPRSAPRTPLWDKVAPELSVTHRVIRWDLPGHGGSPAGLIGPGATVADLADLVLALADSLGIERFAYAGVSLGGAVGLHLAVHHPERVSSLAVICSSAHFNGGQAVARSGPRWCAREGLAGLAESADARWFTPGFTVPELVARPPRRRPRGVRRLLRRAGRVRPARAAGRRSPRPPCSSPAGEDPATPPAHLREIADAVPGRRSRGDPGRLAPGPRAVPGGRTGRAARRTSAACAKRGMEVRRAGPRRRARGPGAVPADALHRPLPGLHLPLRVGRDLDRPDAQPAASAA